MDEQETLQFAAVCRLEDKVKTWNDDLCFTVPHTKVWYRNEIEKLKTEISSVNDSLEELHNIQATTSTSDSALDKLVVSRVPHEKRPFLEDLDMKGKHNAGGVIDIDWLKQFTGLCIENVSVNVKNITGKHIVEREHCLTGSCYDIRFKVAFLVDEVNCKAGQEESFDTDKCPKISDLRIGIANEQAYFDMKRAVDHIEKEQQIQQFFLMFQSYSKLRYQRQTTFKHFYEKYSKLVLAPCDETLTVCNPEYPAIRINIVWKILVTKDGHTRATFDLLSGVPTELHNQDSKGLLQKLKDKFCHLLKAVGVEKAIDVIITILGK